MRLGKITRWVNSLASMLPSLKFKQVVNLTYPIFKLNTEDLSYRDGLLFANELVIDDKNQEAPTLGQRRLLTTHKLYPLKRTLIDFSAVIRSGGKWFIDSNGVAFEYEKVKYTKIKAHKILRKIPKGVSTVLVIQGLNFRVAVSRPPPSSFEWALMMYLNKYTWRIFGYSDEKLPDSRRKI